MKWFAYANFNIKNQRLVSQIRIRNPGIKCSKKTQKIYEKIYMKNNNNPTI